MGKSLMSDHVLFAPLSLAAKLAGLFTSLLRNGHAAVCLRDSIIQPIPKGSKDPAKSSNYRGIALASCLSKLLELCILLIFPDYFNTSGSQLASRKDALQICAPECSLLMTMANMESLHKIVLQSTVMVSYE